MTVEAKSIKFKRLLLDTDAVADGVLVRANSGWLLDDKITVVGFELAVEMNTIALTGENEDTELLSIANFTKSTALEDNVVFGSVAIRANFPDITIGLVTYAGSLAKSCEQIVVMFPEGYGVDMSPGEYLYVVGDAIYFNAGGALYTAQRAYIYYVERR